MNNRIIAGLTLIFLLLAGCNSSRQPIVGNDDTDNVVSKFVVVWDSASEREDTHRVMTIGIDSMLTLSELHQITDHILSDDAGKHDSLRLAFRLGGYGSYVKLHAWSEIGPNSFRIVIEPPLPEPEAILVAEHVGVPESTEPEVKKRPLRKDKMAKHEIIGAGYDTFFGTVHTIFRNNGRTYIESAYSDGTVIIDPLERRSGGGYYVEGDRLEYFVVKSDGIYVYFYDGMLSAKYPNTSW